MVEGQCLLGPPNIRVLPTFRSIKHSLIKDWTSYEGVWSETERESIKF
jgi:hypothetical protein